MGVRYSFHGGCILSMSDNNPKGRAPTNPKLSTSKLKIIILGGINAGKTCLLRRYCFNTFDSERRATIGADYFTKQIVNPLLSSDDISKSSIPVDPLVHIQLWDTAGLEGSADNSIVRQRSCALGKSFFRNIHGALLVYDATSYHSFCTLIQWYQILLENTGTVGNRKGVVPVVVVANKIDKLKYELVKPFLKMVPQRNVLGIGASSCTKIEIASNNQRASTANAVKFHGPGLKQITIQDITRKAGKSYGTLVPPTTTTNNTDSFDPPIRSIPQDDINETDVSLDQLHDIRAVNEATYQKLAVMAEEGKSYSLALNSDFYGSILNPETSENLETGDIKHSQRKKDSDNSVSFKSIWKESSSIDDTLPDRDMVLQWCKSNNVTFSEASALDGTGVDEAVESLIRLALKQLNKLEEEQRQKQPISDAAASGKSFYRTNNWIRSSTKIAVGGGENNGKAGFHYLHSKINDETAGFTTTVPLLQPKNNKIIDLQARYKARKSNRSTSCCGCTSLSHCWPFDD